MCTEKADGRTEVTSLVNGVNLTRHEKGAPEPTVAAELPVTAPELVDAADTIVVLAVDARH